MPLHPPSRPIVVDASALTDADASVLDALVRMQLDARRIGTSIRLANAPRQLVDLLALFGLSDVLPVDAESGVEVERQIEQREQLRVDEEIDRGDPAR